MLPSSAIPRPTACPQTETPCRYSFRWSHVLSRLTVYSYAVTVSFHAFSVLRDRGLVFSFLLPELTSFGPSE